MPEFKIDLLEDVEINDIDKSDYPNIYGFITSAYYKGKQMTDDQIDKLNLTDNNGVFINTKESII